ncbi:hypothetical protein F0L74_17095 [Chitinophaga agrisoli]|uniref:LTXXQ motif family protein n=1 Tax=Chitinophaga agrisoli TaxID=2607653 RepID=A0A5B2VTJ2_9BACT|nr:hypothetical protein [Chitinophaga agrisoli]KAA2241606.1 hypothetical protein F0L74_17095 [Chitinophaga agrisoli]
MKLLLSILLLSFSTHMLAQAPPMPGKKLKEALSLTAQQYNELHRLTATYRQQIKDIQGNGQLTDTPQLAQLKGLQQTYDAKVKGLLNGPQYEQFLQWTAKRQAQVQRVQQLQDRQLPGRTSPGKT